MANILVVDDSAADRELAGHLLEEHSWTVVYAEDGKQALARMRANAVDLVLTDLAMPEVDGLALVEQVKADYPSVTAGPRSRRGGDTYSRRIQRAQELQATPGTAAGSVVRVGERPRSDLFARQLFDTGTS